MELPAGLLEFANIITDSYFIVDRQRTIVAFNHSFHAMLPRNLARQLKGKKCYDVLQLEICQEGCIAEGCWKLGRHMRLDEINGRYADQEQEHRFILSAIPIHNDQGELIGAMEVQRDVTDEALVQAKYQSQMEASTRTQQKLEEELNSRTRRLLEVSRRLYETQKALLKAKTEFFS